MLFKPLGMTIEELASRWEWQGATRRQILDFCRTGRLEILFSADDKWFWAGTTNEEGAPMIVAECQISGYVSLQKAAIARLLAAPSYRQHFRS